MTVAVKSIWTLPPADIGNRDIDHVAGRGVRHAGCAAAKRHIDARQVEDQIGVKHVGQAALECCRAGHPGRVGVGDAEGRRVACVLRRRRNDGLCQIGYGRLDNPGQDGVGCSHLDAGSPDCEAVIPIVTGVIAAGQAVVDQGVELQGDRLRACVVVVVDQNSPE